MTDHVTDAAPARPAAADEQHDRTLDRLIAAAGLGHALDDVKAFAAGVAAAPAASLPGRTATTAALPLLGIVPASDLAAAFAALVEECRRRFDTDFEVADRSDRLAALRAELGARGLDGFVLPHADEHHNEFVPKRALRLAWLTGFTGSAGFAVVLGERAAIFVDGRYTLQARNEVDLAAFTPRHITEEPAAEWIAESLAEGATLGYDPWLHTENEVKRLGHACGKAGASLIAMADNPIDAIWHDQPPPPLAPVVPHDIAFAGEPSADKRDRLAAALRAGGCDAALITAPDSLAWLLNIRGGDVPCTPLPLAFGILHGDASVDLFIDPRKLAPGLEQHLGPAVRLHPVDALADALAVLGHERSKVRLDPATASAWIFERLEAAGGAIDRGGDPCTQPKACKNAVELAGARAAHLRDGAALTRFLAWLARSAPEGHLDELAAARKLAALRAATERIQGLSFTTISGAGPNGAIVHYRVSAASNRRLEPGQLYLIDSGGQYLDGTTDVTRTVAIGVPSNEMRDRFTRVLKGHIAVATCRFPEGTTGSQIDTLARTALWQSGLDYDHGTGHGVGSYLGVHEGPQRISKLPNQVALEPGMIVSNEPGYYKAGEYGIRIENLVAVVALDDLAGAERPMLCFETLTRAPIDVTLVELSLLSEVEIAWLDGYHAEVRAALMPLLDNETARWLDSATRPLAR